MNDVSQSAATQSIHRLERHLGVQLVDRSRRPFVLTSEGQICYDGFRSILESYDTVVSMVQNLNAKESGIINVGAIYSVGLHGMKYVMQEFMKSFPKTKVKLDIMRAGNIYQAIMTSEIDFGIVSFPMASPEITVILLASERLVYVCSPDHELAEQKSISLDQLHGSDFIAFERDQVIRKEIDRHFRQRLASVNIVAEYENIETIKQAVEVGLGGSILPKTSVQTEVRLGKLAAVPIVSPKIMEPLGIIHKQGKVFTPAMTKFISHLTEYKWDTSDEE